MQHHKRHMKYNECKVREIWCGNAGVADTPGSGETLSLRCVSDGLNRRIARGEAPMRSSVIEHAQLSNKHVRQCEHLIYNQENIVD